MRALRPALLFAALAMAAVPAESKTCPAPGKAAAKGQGAARTCQPPPRYEPYDPDRMRAGSRPGFVDLGNGTEMRVGGRTSLEFGTRR